MFSPTEKRKGMRMRSKGGEGKKDVPKVGGTKVKRKRRKSRFEEWVRKVLHEGKLREF